MQLRILLGLDGQIAIATIEQICPFPFDIVQEECNKYSNAELVFCQEEHKNQGAWCYVQPRMQTAVGGYDRRVHYCGREVSCWKCIHENFFFHDFDFFSHFYFRWLPHQLPDPRLNTTKSSML